MDLEKATSYIEREIMATAIVEISIENLTGKRGK